MDSAANNEDGVICGIVGHCKDGRAREGVQHYQYQVRWFKESEKADTWEPPENVPANLVEEYNANLPP